MFIQWVTSKCMYYCVFDFFLFNLVSTSVMWVTRKCMFIVCLTSQTLQCCHTLSACELRHSVCLLRVDKIEEKIVSTSVGELHEHALFIVCLTFFMLQCGLHFKIVSYVKVYAYCVLTIFNSIMSPLSVGVLCESPCLVCVWLFSLLEIEKSSLFIV